MAPPWPREVANSTLPRSRRNKPRSVSISCRHVEHREATAGCEPRRELEMISVAVATHESQMYPLRPATSSETSRSCLWQNEHRNPRNLHRIVTLLSGPSNVMSTASVCRHIPASLAVLISEQKQFARRHEVSWRRFVICCGACKIIPRSLRLCRDTFLRCERLYLVGLRGPWLVPEAWCRISSAPSMPPAETRGRPARRPAGFRARESGS